MADAFDIVKLETPQSVVFRVSGNLDARTSSQLVQKSREVQDQGKNLVLNLAGVLFIASSGIGALLAIVEDFKEVSLSVRLAALSPQVNSVIQLLNLDQFLAIDGGEADSLGALSA